MRRNKVLNGLVGSAAAGPGGPSWSRRRSRRRASTDTPPERFRVFGHRAAVALCDPEHTVLTLTSRLANAV
ncbi:MAG: hypothetical protein M3Z97_10170 [Candidatus Dormibacteraeota bacterium]|nr:hypothetical protein [Candidatus Dormibacteraeota bacterium]